MCGDRSFGILKKWELGFFNFVSLYCDILLSLRGRYGGEA